MNDSHKLGGIYPYYWMNRDGSIIESPHIEEIIENIPINQRIIDPVSILSMISFTWISGDRTLIQGLNHYPWFGRITKEGIIQLDDIPPHGNVIWSPEFIAKQLRYGLEQEILTACDGYQMVWLLLSGGLDSRVIAGILHNLQITGKLDVKEIHTATWGINCCRDIEYAQKISARYGWQWHHIPLDTDCVIKNIVLAAEFLGAEVPPIHLHNMGWFTNLVDTKAIVLAASYGDGVGRGEFSSQHLLQLPSLKPRDSMGVLRKEVIEYCIPQLLKDISSVRSNRKFRSEVGWREVEHEAHYMRRKINHAMSIITRWVPLAQTFSTPSVFSITWNIDPAYRTDSTYHKLLEYLDPILLTIPWAKTGRPIVNSNGIKNENLYEDFHNYGYWLRKKWGDYLGNIIFDGNLDRFNIFDMDQLRSLFYSWKKESVNSYTYLCEIISWLASLNIFCEKFGISTSIPISIKSNHLVDIKRRHNLGLFRQKFFNLTRSFPIFLVLRRKTRKYMGLFRISIRRIYLKTHKNIKNI